jgi:hypothetical protein
MTSVPERRLSEGQDIIRILRQSQRIRPVRGSRVRVLSMFGALLVLSGALAFVLRSQLPPTSPQAADTPEVASVPTRPESPQTPAALRGTLSNEGSSSQSTLDNDGAPAPSTAEPVSPPESSSNTTSLPLSPATTEQTKEAREPDDQMSTVGQVDRPDAKNVPLRGPDGLLLRAEQLLATGDLAAARLLFERVVAAGDLRGAEGLARSYDPEALRQLPVFGIPGDPAAATRWRETARSRQPKSLEH